MPRKSVSEKPVEEKVEEVVIPKLKRGRKKKEPVATVDPVEESTPAPVKKVRRKRVKVSEEPPAVIEEVKEEKPKKKPRALKVEKTSDPKPKRPPSKWLLHVADFRKKNPEMSYKDVLKKAKETYTK